MASDALNTVGAYEAKTHFSELLDKVESGQEITITKHGTPVAKLVPVKRKHTREELSAWGKKGGRPKGSGKTTKKGGKSK